MRAAFPFSAIVGQDEMKQALLIAATYTTVGGVLVLGDRGTGKSTAVRSLSAPLPEMEVVVGYPYGCAPSEVAGPCGACEAHPEGDGPAQMVAVPVVDMPLGATEDRVVGALDLERALSRGEKAFEPGLLARANRGFLYIDEVNLLEDHLVDLLIDVAASGENLVEREGLSVRHPARFVLVGSGNPEEGEPRPQLLDRFGLSVEVRTPNDIAMQIAIVRRRDAFDRDRAGFVAEWRAEDAAVRERIAAARECLLGVIVPDAVLEDAARLCMRLGTDGLRAELTLLRAARALAALAGDMEVTRAHVLDIAPSALRYRLRRDPLDDAGSSARMARAVQDQFGA